MQAAKNTATRARVTVTLEIPVPDAWGADCTLGQVYVQAKDSAIGILRRYFDLGDGVMYSQEQKARIVGEPTVVAIHTEGRAR